MQKKIAQIKLGNKVKDSVSGLTGIVTSRIEYITGCVQFGVAQKVKADGTLPDTVYIDESRLEVVDKGVAVDTVKTGGVMRDAPKKSTR